MRWLKHLIMTRRALNRAFPSSTLDAIEAAIGEAEKGHRGEIRFAIEAALEPTDLMRGTTVRQRALQVFVQLGVWDTEENNGVLVYVLLAERAVEVVADRGFRDRISDAQWQEVCMQMASAFRADHFQEGAVDGVAAIARLIGTLFPGGDRGNELSNRPTLL